MSAGYDLEGMVGHLDMLRSQRETQPGILEQMFATPPMHRERFRAATASLRALKPASV